jgi:hypothetical protein
MTMHAEVPQELGELVLENGRGQPLNVGRKHRVVPPALRRALFARDRHCRYPGCTHTKWLHAHHVMHWIDGGWCFVTAGGRLIAASNASRDALPSQALNVREVRARYALA